MPEQGADHATALSPRESRCVLRAVVGDWRLVQLAEKAMKKRRPIKVGSAVVIALAAFQVSQLACHGQQPKAVLKVDAQVVYSVAFSPDGRMVAAGCGDGRIELWEVASHKRRATLGGHIKPALSAAFSGDGKLLASGGYDGTGACGT
jgi:WD40 repeat protein